MRVVPYPVGGPVLRELIEIRLERLGERLCRRQLARLQPGAGGPPGRALHPERQRRTVDRPPAGHAPAAAGGRPFAGSDGAATSVSERVHATLGEHGRVLCQVRLRWCDVQPRTATPGLRRSPARSVRRAVAETDIAACWRFRTRSRRTQRLRAEPAVSARPDPYALTNAECRDDSLQALEPSSLPADYTGEQLLQFALCQNRVVSLNDLPSRLYETGFLPAGEQPWLSLPAFRW